MPLTKSIVKNNRAIIHKTDEKTYDLTWRISNNIKDGVPKLDYEGDKHKRLYHINILTYCTENELYFLIKKI